MALRALELCAGYGGFSLGLRLCGIETRTVCMVEREAYAAAVLVAQMEAGWLDPAPVWSDLCTFDSRPWRGAVDLVCAGFPCQPWSLAGKRLGEADDRWIWPDIARIVEECRPSLVFLENVELAAFRRPRVDLESLGYRVGPAVRVSASDVGAPHQRDRWWVLGCLPDADQVGRDGRAWAQREGWRDESADNSTVLADSSRNGWGEGGAKPEGPQRRSDASQCGQAMADTSGTGLAQGRAPSGSGEEQPELAERSVDPHPDGQRKPQPQGLKSDERGRLGNVAWWESEPDVGRVVDGCPDRVDQLRLLGNGVVPLACAVAFRTLLSDALPSA